MERDEATAAWQTISTIYGLHPERVAENAPVWVEALETMDVEAVASILLEWISGRGPERLPSIVSFAADVRIWQRRNRPVAPATPQRRDEKPLWVYAWEILQAEWEGAKGMHPVLPEQKPGFDSMIVPWPPDGRRVLQAGSPEYDNLMELAREKASR